VAYRVNLDAFAEKEKGWEKTRIGGTNPADFLAVYFQVSGDGKRAVDNIPWPMIGILNLENNTYDSLRNGGAATPALRLTTPINGSISGECMSGSIGTLPAKSRAYLTLFTRNPTNITARNQMIR
jgi:hypothetical protein